MHITTASVHLYYLSCELRLAVRLSAEWARADSNATSQCNSLDYCYNMVSVTSVSNKKILREKQLLVFKGQLTYFNVKGLLLVSMFDVPRYFTQHPWRIFFMHFRCLTQSALFTIAFVFGQC